MGALARTSPGYLVGAAQAAEAGSGLRTQYILARVKKVDVPKLRAAVGGWRGAVAEAALVVVDEVPRAALRVASPLVSRWLRDNYGVESEVEILDAPPPYAPSRSELFPGLLAGALVGVVGGAVGGFLLGRRVG